VSADSARPADTRPEWFVVGPGRKPFGPYSMARLRAYAKDGRLTRTALLWRKGMSAWIQAQEVQGVFPPPRAPRPVAPRSSAVEPLPGRVIERASAAADRGAGMLELLEVRPNPRVESWTLGVSVVASVGAVGVVVFATVQAVRAVGFIGALPLVILSLAGCASLPLGWAFTRIGLRTVRNTPARISSRTVLIAPGLVALLLGTVLIAVAAFGMIHSGSLVPLILVGGAAGVLFAFALYGMCIHPESIGVKIDPNSSMGEDSITLWGAPFRIALASSGLAMALVQVAGFLGGLAGLLMVVVAKEGEAMPIATGTALAIWCGGSAITVGFLPMIVYYVTVLQYLIIGVVESILAVGRHVREQKRQGSEDGPTAT
jgi:hypothetical protein